jgi:two-component system sensor histidine kinase KdpD
MMPSGMQRQAAWFRYSVSLAVVAAITFLYFAVIQVNYTTVALTLLLAILGIAAKYGLGESVAASMLAGFCFNFFFLPPVGTLTIEDPQNWVALSAFLVTAIVASQLSASARRRTAEALQRQAEMEKLYSLSRSLMLVGAGEDMAAHAARLLAQTFDDAGVVVYDRATGAVHRAGSHDVPLPDSKLHDTALQGNDYYDAPTDTFVLPIRLGADPVGSLAVTGGRPSDTALHSAANVVAVALEAGRAREAAGRADAARQSEELKSALLDALAHEFKTPLTSIKAGATALLAGGVLTPVQNELLTVINEETDRLDALVTDTVRAARIESGETKLQARQTTVDELLARAMHKVRAGLENRPLSLQTPPGLPPVIADPELMAIAIGNLLDNALKYTPAGTAIHLGAREDDGLVILTVADHGPGIAPKERGRIFERFHRGPGARHVPGTGMGLAIAGEIVRLHKGRLWLDHEVAEGASFSLALPAARPEGQP